MSGARPDAYVDFVRGFFDRWSPLYDAFARPIGSAYAAAARAAGAAPGRRLLDLCTGTGEIAVRCARLGATVTAVDLTPSMLARARRKGAGLGVRFVEMDARRVAFADASFDAVLLSFALHDMPGAARRAALLEAVRVARERVVVLDYEPPARGWRRRLVQATLECFETPYLRGFRRDGGVAGALRAAGLAGRRLAAPWPGLCGLWRIEV
jgi:demethylmenaquinone methyltransferase/2-methoxy-6-polyprenyl-1,4-benzoquinol methylase